MSFHIGEMVIVNKDVVRQEGPYANKGDLGVVIDIFTSGNDVNDRRMNAKVSMFEDGSVKTFRLTSIDKLSDWGF